MSGVIAGRYRLEDRIAAGGMGEVWTAHDQTLGRRVAVKLLRDSLAEDRIVAERFRREALTAASISHPNMADVYDYIEERGRPGIVMEFVDGETLATRLTRGPMPVEEAVRVASEVLLALQAAHEAGVVHRDIKPGNIMITPKGRVKVTDFGIARAEGDATLTETGTVMGTAHYAAPEQVQGRGATPASDLYSLGIVLYEALTGHKPFEAETPVAAALSRLTNDPPRPRRYRAGIPAPLETVVMRALAREPDARFASAPAMHEALARAISAADTEAMPTEVLPVTTGPAETTRVLPVTPPAADATNALPRAAGMPATARRPRERRPIVIAVLLVLAVAAALLVALARRGPTMVAAPAVESMRVREAILEANRLGLKVDLRETTSSSEAGTVVGQSPKPGTPLESGGRLVLFVSKGPPPEPPCCTVPDLIGLSKDDAEALLHSSGLELGDVKERTRRGVREDTVIEQNPGKGRVLAPGDSVDIVIVKKGNGD